MAIPFQRATVLQVFTVLPLILAGMPVYAEDAESGHWWSGISITPGIGWRALNIDMTNSAGDANLQTDFASSLFGALDIESPRYKLSDNLSVSVLGHASTVRATEQWVVDGSGTGGRQSLGTSISGHYSYLAPALTWGARQPAGTGLELSLGVGTWSGQFSGDAIFAPNNQANASMPHTPLSVSFKELGYDTRFSLYFGRWAWVMTVGGPFKFSNQGVKYQFQQVALIVGYEFRL
ncbi:MAG: hypothetical protein OEV31_01705 [Gammaproteobacteria bacterium]|nr:hypothetical protein [Gammaproteobacteria bacterium]